MKTIALLLAMGLCLADPAAAQEAPTARFKGHPCTKDCSGHRAGYAWAEKKAIERHEDCRGRSESFVKGCRIYAGERQDADKPAQEQPDQED